MELEQVNWTKHTMMLMLNQWRNRPGLVLLAWALLLGFTGMGFTEVVQEQVSLDECLRRAAMYNPRIETAEASLAQANEDYKSARSTLYPTLNGSASYGKSSGDVDFSEATDRSSLGLSARYDLFSGGADRAGIRQAAARVLSSEADNDRAWADVEASVRSSFARLLFAQENEALTRQIAQRQKQNVELVELRYEIGKEHKGSLLRLQASYKDAEFEVVRAQRALRIAQRELVTAMGLSNGAELVAKGELQAPVLPEEPVMSTVLALTPEHRKAESSVESARQSLVTARAGLYPSLGVSVSGSRDGEDWPPEEEGWSAGISMSIPLFTGGRNIANLRSAEFALRGSEADLRSTDDQTRLDLDSAWTDLQDALQALEVQQAFLEAAEARAEIGRNQYAGGLLTFENWTQIEDELTQAQKSMLSGRLDALLKETAWNRVRGVTIGLKR